MTHEHLENMAAVLMQYRADHFLCDALVMVDDGELQAHSVILSAVSPVFKAAFTLPNVSHCARVSNVNMDVMKLALDAIYTGWIEYGERSDVTNLLVGLEVDISKLNEGRNNKMSVTETTVKGVNEVYPRSDDDDESDLCFNSIEVLGHVEAAIVDHLVHDKTRSAENLQDVFNVSKDSEPDLVETDPLMVEPYCKSLDKINRCNSGYNCTAVDPQQMKQLGDLYKSLCFRRQLLLLASLMESVRAEKHVTDAEGPPRRTWTVKYFLPSAKAGERIRVCQATFCGVFKVAQRKLFFLNRDVQEGKELLDGRSVRYQRMKQSSSELVENGLEEKTDAGDDPRDDAKQNNNRLSLDDILSSDCQCRECKGQYRCEHCGHRSLTRRCLTQHVRKKCRMAAQIKDAEPRGGSDCSYCSSSFASRKELREHKMSQHRRLPSSEKNCYVCDICQKGFCALSSLKDHREGFHSDQSRLCPICGKNIRSLRYLRKHMECHRGETRTLQLKCDLCPSLVFIRRLSLVKHKEKVHGIIATRRVFACCDACGVCLGSNDALRRHKKKACHPLEELSTVRMNEQREAAAHSVIERFQNNLCPVCGKKLKSATFLAKHMVYHEKKSAEEKIRKEFKLNCDICFEVFKRHIGYVKHMVHVHGVIESSRRLVYCDSCGASFASRKGLGVHKRGYCPTVKKEKIFQTEVVVNDTIDTD